MFAGKGQYLTGIRDATNMVNAGSLAVLSDTQTKIGQTTGYFPGSAVTSAIYSPTSTRFARGTNPYTIEIWFYQTAITNTFPTLVSNDWNTRSNFLSGDWVIQTHRNITGQIRKVSWVQGTITSAAVAMISTSTLALDTWNHIAIVRTAAAGAVMGTSTIDSSGVLTVGTLTSGTISAGLYLTGTGVPAGTYIESNISGSGAGSTWQTNTTTAVSSTTITGNNLNMYINGTNEARLNNAASLEGAATNRRLTVGTFGTNTASPYIGYADEFRFSTVARYFTNFTPQTTPFVDDPDTLCLLHMDGENNTQIWTDDNT